MPFDQTQPYAVVSGHGSQYYLQGGQAYSLNGVAISEPNLSDPVEESVGVTAFTQLTDVPTAITPKTLIVGNDAANALISPDWVTVDSQYHGIDLHPAVPDPDGYGAYIGVNTSTGQFNNAQMSVNETQAILNLQAGNTSNVSLTAEGSTATLRLFVGDFIMIGFDVVASDAAAKLTVDAVEYSIAKAMKVKIGDDTYFWPLFGPVAP